VNPEQASIVSRWSRPSCHKGKAVGGRGSNRPENPSSPAGVVGSVCAGEEIIAVGRRENRVQGVALPRSAHPGGPSQEMQVMVAEHDDDPVAMLHSPAQHLQRPWPAVDQITHQPEAVLPRIERDAAQEALKGLEAAVDVADRIGRNGP
jgi:hypothetical protein